MQIALESTILRDKETNQRQYGIGLVSFQLKGRKKFHIDINNYQVNSKSTTFRFLHTLTDSYTEAERLYKKKIKAKLAKDRHVHSESLTEFTTVLELIKFLTIGSQFKLSSVNGKKLAQTIKTKVEQLSAGAEETFMEKAERELSEIEAKPKPENLGKETAKSNENWGLF